MQYFLQRHCSVLTLHSEGVRRRAGHGASCLHCLPTAAAPLLRGLACTAGAVVRSKQQKYTISGNRLLLGQPSSAWDPKVICPSFNVGLQVLVRCS